MAIINKTGIGEGTLIEAEHLTRIYDSLNGTGSYEIVATGSLQGTSSFAVSASYALAAQSVIGSIDTASFAYTASTAILSTTASFVTPLAQNVIVTGSLTLSGSALNSLIVQRSSIFNDPVTVNDRITCNTTASIGNQNIYPADMYTTSSVQRDVWSVVVPSGNSIMIDASICSSYLEIDAITVRTLAGTMFGAVSRDIGGISTSIIAPTVSSSITDGTWPSPPYGIRVSGTSVYVWVNGNATNDVGWTLSIRATYASGR